MTIWGRVASITPAATRATRRWRASHLGVRTWPSTSSASSQTVIKPPKNKYTPQQDVELGREAAAEVRKQYPIIKNDRITSYLTKLGDRLVAAAPPELKEPVYEFSFTPVNLKEINAFAPNSPRRPEISPQPPPACSLARGARRCARGDGLDRSRPRVLAPKCRRRV